MCHSDLSFISGLYPWPLPAVCGHEGAGIVAEVGEAVTHVQPGDHVIVATLTACGMCKACANGRPTSCRATLGNAAPNFTLDGEPVVNFAGASVFSERTVVRDVQCVKIPDDVPLTSAALVGCGVVTGMGAVFNRANVQLGDSAVVFGVGGVGLNVIQALKVKGARNDHRGRHRAPTRRVSPGSSAPPTSSTARRDDIVDAIVGARAVRRREPARAVQRRRHELGVRLRRVPPGHGERARVTRLGRHVRRDRRVGHDHRVRGSLPAPHAGRPRDHRLPLRAPSRRSATSR